MLIWLGESLSSSNASRLDLSAYKVVFGPQESCYDLPFPVDLPASFWRGPQSRLLLPDTLVALAVNMALPAPSLPSKPTPTTVPATLLPSSSSAQKQYLHTTQQAHLRRLYSHQVLHAAQQQELDQLRLQRRGRNTRSGTRRGRRGSPTGASDDDEWSDEHALAQAQAQASANEEFGEAYVKRRKVASGPEDAPLAAATAAPPLALSPPVAAESERIDSAHVYHLSYDLSPAGSSDAFYHGPHPPPPAAIVRAVLKASRTPPFFDPDGLAVHQLEAITRDLWEGEGGGAQVGAQLDGAVVDREVAQREDEWEQDLVAQFSTGCAARIARTVAALPPSQRPVFQPPPPAQIAHQLGPPPHAQGPPPVGHGAHGPGGMGRGQSPFLEQQDPRDPRQYQPQKHWPQFGER